MAWPARKRRSSSVVNRSASGLANSARSTEDNVADRALDELSRYLPKLLVVKNINTPDFDYGDGHARGALQGLTAQGPVVAAAAGDSEASGESLDHRIGRELNPDGRDSLFLYSGEPSGWLGGPCNLLPWAWQIDAAPWCIRTPATWP